MKKYVLHNMSQLTCTLYDVYICTYCIQHLMYHTIVCRKKKKKYHISLYTRVLHCSHHFPAVCCFMHCPKVQALTSSAAATGHRVAGSGRQLIRERGSGVFLHFLPLQEKSLVLFSFFPCIFLVLLVVFRMGMAEEEAAVPPQEGGGTSESADAGYYAL